MVLPTVSIIGKLVVSSMLAVVSVVHLSFWQPGASLHRLRTSASNGHSINPVKVVACVEALCPDCREFLSKQIVPTYQMLGSSVIDLEVVVFGNAQIIDESDESHSLDQPKKVECQHGVAECDANTYEQCAIHLYPYPERYLPFLTCLDETLPHRYNRDEPMDASLFAKCARFSALDFESIAACHNDPEMAWKLNVEASKKTPDNHQYVPWIVINGLHGMDEEKESFVDAVCKAYRAAGGNHPACSSSSHLLG